MYRLFLPLHFFFSTGCCALGEGFLTPGFRTLLGRPAGEPSGSLDQASQGWDPGM